jgi:hypothetical protein
VPFALPLTTPPVDERTEVIRPLLCFCSHLLMLKHLGSETAQDPSARILFS